MAEDNLHIPTLDGNVLRSIHQAVVKFHQYCGVQYRPSIVEEALYNESCQEASRRGFPMDGNYSIRPYVAFGAAMVSNAYSHLTDPAMKTWFCLYNAVGTSIDDRVGKVHDMEHVYRFNERFASCQPQGDPGLSAFDVIVREVTRHYSLPVSNMFVTSNLNFITSLLFDHETKNMQILSETCSYSNYSRMLSAAGEAYAYTLFPATLPLQEYIQCIPDILIIINQVNDILSYYKEEMEGDTATYLSRIAASRAIAKLDALHEVVEKTVQAHHNILKSLKPQTEAYDAYMRFFHGYIRLHAAPRYKLGEIMSESLCCSNS